MKRRQLELRVSIGSLREHDVRSDALQSDDSVHPAAFDGYHLAVLHESELFEELDRGRQVFDHDAHVIHPLDSHAIDRSRAPMGLPDRFSRLEVVGTESPDGDKRRQEQQHHVARGVRRLAAAKVRDRRANHQQDHSDRRQRGQE